MEPLINEKIWLKDFEPAIVKNWREKKCYAFDSNTSKQIFSIDTPPPYVNTPVHIGQATTYVLMDMFARYRRMKGFEVLFPLGLDRNGLPIEMAAEKKFKVRCNSVPREQFIEMCKKVLEESSLASVDSFYRLGISFCSWEFGTAIGDGYYTDSKLYRTLTQDSFIELYNKGLIYEAERSTNYCPGCRTTIADSEVDYLDIPSIFNEIVFKVKETGEEIVIGTTRPELICTCAIILYHPDDERWQHLKGKHAITPIYNKEVPIKAHPMASMEKGTGLVMMCSFGDNADIRFFRDENLPVIIAINIDGTMNNHSGFLEGMKVLDARKRITEELKAKGILVKEHKIQHRTPVCERSKNPIEIISMSELYLKQIDYKDDLLRIANELNFYEDKSRQMLIDWINNISIDWPISRRRVYATEVPLWYCRKCKKVIVPEKGKYHQPWKDECPTKVCECGSTEFIGDTRVFDTWFDSSISPLYILKWERDNSFFRKAFPASLRPQGKEIVRTWLYYTILKDYLLTGKKIFNDVWINYHIVDEKGNKMSKSQGNVIDPKDVLDKYGAEPFRLWSAIEGNLERDDFKCSFERIDGATKTLTKLWNLARFISQFEKPAKIPNHLEETDQWILGEMNRLIKLAENSYSCYDFHKPAQEIKHFLWETLASHYVELVKNRAYNNQAAFTKSEQEAAAYTLHTCLELMLRLLSPIIPIATSKIYAELVKENIHSLSYPIEQQVKDVAFSTEELCELDKSIWKMKKDMGKSLKEQLPELSIPSKFRAIERDFMATHSIGKINYV